MRHTAASTSRRTTTEPQVCLCGLVKSHDLGCWKLSLGRHRVQERLTLCSCMTGVYLSKDLMAIAGHALKANITTLAPLVLPVSEQLLFFINLVARKARLCRCLCR